MPTKGEEMFFSAYVCVLVMVTAAWALRLFTFYNQIHHTRPYIEAGMVLYNFL